MDRQMIEYLPEWLREFQEIKEITKQQQIQAQQLWTVLEDVIWKNNFIESLDENGCSRWERMLGIQNKDTYTVEECRLKILGMLAEQRPFTMRMLERTLAVLCGENTDENNPNYKVDLDAGNYKLTVRIAMSSENVFSDVIKLLDRIVPCNLVVDVELLYNQHKELAQYTHEQLSEYTHEELKKNYALNRR